MMKYFFFYLLLFTTVFGFSQNNSTANDGYTIEKTRNLPNMLEISDNFYVDKTEVSNIAYREYLAWIKRVFGPNSIEYLTALPDQSVWSIHSLKGDLDKKYLNDLKYDDHPVVGITIEQAQKYTDWRTERILEMFLIENRIIAINPSPSRDNYFSLERLKNGEYPTLKKIASNFIYPKLTIPTSTEWQLLSGINSSNYTGIDSTLKHNRKYFKRNKLNIPISQKRKKKKRKKNPIKKDVDSALNIHGLYHTVGNVAEFVSDKPGYTIGGSWKNKIPLEKIGNPIRQNTPNCWTGFRCVARFETIQIKPTINKKE